jgi:flagellar biosynthesis protein FlhB
VLSIEHSPFSAYTDSITVLYHVFIGICSASFWRGAWYILDDILFPQSKELSALASLMLGTSGMLAIQGYFERIEDYMLQYLDHRKSYRRLKWVSAKSLQYSHSVLRFAAIYSLALSVVFVWRGTWMSWDILYAKFCNHYAENKMELLPVAPLTKNNAIDEEATIKKRIHASDPGHAFHSGLMSHYAAVITLSCLGLFASVFAPPAAISVIRDNTIFRTKTSIERMLYPNIKINRSAMLIKHSPRQSKFVPSWRYKRRKG